MNIQYAYFISAEFVLYDSNSEVIAKKTAASASIKPQQSTEIAQVQITKRQPLVLGIRLPGGIAFDGVGKYKVRIDGAVEFGGNRGNIDEAFRRSLAGTETKNGDCLPKQGTLIIKMKNGSKKIIDLSEAETITVVP